MNKALSWKVLIPFGVIWLAIFNNSALALVGTIALLFGIIDGIRAYLNSRKKTDNNA